MLFREALPPLPSRGHLAGSASPSEYVSVHEDKFHMVNASLMLLNMLGEYLDLTRRIPQARLILPDRIARANNRYWLFNDWSLIYGESN